jgi:biopolymer transport protein ExbB/TolQ
MGITKVKLPKYVLGGLGMIPGTIVYVYFGTAISNISDAASGDFDGGVLQLVLLVGGSFLAIIAVCYVSYVARKEVKKVLKKNADKEELDKANRENEENDESKEESKKAESPRQEESNRVNDIENVSSPREFQAI